MTNELKAQFTRRITEANPTEMVVILYDMALEYIDEALDAHKADDRKAFRLAISRVRGCIDELMHSVNLEYEPAPTLLKLYIFSIRRLAACEFKFETEGLTDIRKIIEPLRDAYDKIAPENTAGPVMQGTQKVYAGLTYGRDDVNEDMMSESNRGFKA